jgi:hypothetical protein
MYAPTNSQTQPWGPEAEIRIYEQMCRLHLYLQVARVLITYRFSTYTCPCRIELYFNVTSQPPFCLFIITYLSARVHWQKIAQILARAFSGCFHDFGPGIDRLSYGRIPAWEILRLS